MAGYSRQDTNNNIATGNVINADDFDNEYNAIESAFNEATGHKHDGTAGEGAPIEKVGPSQDLVVTAAKVEAKTTNTLDLGSTGVKFKDAFFDGTVNTDGLTVNESSTLTGNVTASADLSVGGNLTVTGDTTINGNLTFGNADTDTVSFGAEIDSNIIPDDGDTFDLGNSEKQWRNLYIDGTANIDSLVADTADINGGTIDGTAIGSNTAAAGSFTTITATGAITGDVTGTVSDVSNHTTDDISEETTNPTNKYFTNTRARDAISVTDSGGDGSLSYSAASGVITYQGPVAADARAHFSATNSGTGYGSIAYDSLTGAFTYTKITDTDILNRFSAGEGINVASGVISGEDASTSNKGIASFAIADFNVTAGAVSLKDEAIEDVVGGMVDGNSETGVTLTYDDTNGKIDVAITADPVLTISGDASGTATMTNLTDTDIAITIANNAVALGTQTTGNYVASVSAGTGVTVSGSASEGSTHSFSIGQDVGTTADVDFATVTTTGNVTVGGNLTVSGTTTTINTTQVNVADNIMLLNSDVTGTPTEDAGIEIERGTAVNKKFIWDESADEWSTEGEDIRAGHFYGNLTGTVSGNIDTATKLATARNFSLTGDVTSNTVTFDGSGNLQLTTSMANNSVDLGTHTTGNYVNDVTAGSGISVTHTPAEGSSPTVAHGNTSSVANVNASGNTFVQDMTFDTYGHVQSVTTNTVSIGDATITISAGDGLSTGGNFTTNATTNKTITLNHADTSSQASVDNSGGTVIQDVDLDGYGHVTALTSVNLDDRYVINSGDIVTGDLRFNDNVALNLGSGIDAELYNNGSNTYLDINNGQNFYIRDGNSSNATRFTFDADTGNFIATGKATVNTVDLGNWEVTETSGVLYFSYGGTNKMKLDSSGNLTVTGNVTAYGTV